MAIEAVVEVNPTSGLTISGAYIKIAGASIANTNPVDGKTKAHYTILVFATEEARQTNKTPVSQFSLQCDVDVATTVESLVATGYEALKAEVYPEAVDC